MKTNQPIQNTTATSDTIEAIHNNSATLKPPCPIIGANGNIFSIMGIASKTLKKNNMTEAASEMCSRVMESESYDNALAVIMEYVEPVGVDEEIVGDMNIKM